jgi:hypothetical protein
MIEVLKNKMSKLKKGYTTTHRNKTEFMDHDEDKKSEEMKKTLGQDHRGGTMGN